MFQNWRNKLNLHKAYLFNWTILGYQGFTPYFFCQKFVHMEDGVFEPIAGLFMDKF